MAPNRPAEKKGPTPKTILDDAETQFDAGNLEEAITLALNALELTGKGGDFELRAANLLGTLSIEVGEIEDATLYFQRAVELDPEGHEDEKVGGGPEKFLSLAQLSPEGGMDSVNWFTRGAASLRHQLQSLTSTTNKTPEQLAAIEDKQQKLGGVLCAVAEVYMTDLSWEEDAEQRCENFITEAMMVAPSSSEVWQTVANVRISQERTEEARAALKRSLELWQDLPPEHPSIPEFATRIALARLLMEAELEDDALKVLERLISDDDTSVEAWYLGGWCLYIMGEKQRDGKSAQNGADSDEEWQSTWVSARRWLKQCLKQYEIQEYEDDRLGDHARELLSKLKEVVGEGDDDDDEEEWDGLSDGEDEDEEMKD